MRIARHAILFVSALASSGTRAQHFVLKRSAAPPPPPEHASILEDIIDSASGFIPATFATAGGSDAWAISQHGVARRDMAVVDDTGLEGIVGVLDAGENRHSSTTLHASSPTNQPDTLGGPAGMAGAAPEKEAELRTLQNFLRRKGFTKSLATLDKEIRAESRGSSSSTLETAKTGVYLFLWYLFNVLYNIDNKKALNVYPLPLTVSAIQMMIGIPIFLIPWMTGLRSAPQLSSADAFKQMGVQGLLHALVHISAVIALGAGAISFVHIVKSAEPVTTAFFSGMVLKDHLSSASVAALLPIVLGVSLASLKELSFTWPAFAGAMISNIASSLRSIYSKKAMKDKDQLGKNLTPSNMYAMLTLFGSALLVPAMLLDINKLKPVWLAARAKGIPAETIVGHIVASGVWYYLYNEISYMALGRLDAVSHAVANTFKRVALILASVLVFGTSFTPLGAAGSGVAVGGTLLYSLSKQRDAARKKERQNMIQTANALGRSRDPYGDDGRSLGITSRKVVM